MSLLYDLLYQLTLLGALGCCVVIFILTLSWAWKNGYLQYLPFYNNLKEAMVQQATNNGMDMIGMIAQLQQQLFNPTVSSAVSKFELSENKTFLTGQVEIDNKIYTLAVPYNLGLANKLRSKKVYLKLTDDSSINITQPPGTLYQISAEQMGGDKIIVKDLTGNIVYKVSGADILTDIKELQG